MVDGAGVVTLGSAGDVGAAEPLSEDGTADDVVGSGLLAGDGLPVGDGLAVGDGLPVGDGLLVGDELPVGDGAAAGGDVADEPADDGGTVAAGTVTGGVLLAADAGNRAPTGSVAGLFLATAGVGVGAGVAAGDGTVWICGPSRPDGLTAALLASPPVKLAELADPAR